MSEYVIRFTAINPDDLDDSATERLAGAARALRLLAAAPSTTAPAMSHQGGGA